MKIKVFPVRFEAYDDIGEGAFKVEAFDDSCATIEIQTPVTLESWLELVPLVTKCIEDLKLVGLS